MQNYTEIGKMLEMSKEPNCNIKDIKAKVKQIQTGDKKYFDSIKKDYSKEFEHILTKKQLRKYNKLKKDKIKKAKQAKKIGNR